MAKANTFKRIPRPTVLKGLNERTKGAEIEATWGPFLPKVPDGMLKGQLKMTGNAALEGPQKFG